MTRTIFMIIIPIVILSLVAIAHVLETVDMHDYCATRTWGACKNYGAP